MRFVLFTVLALTASVEAAPTLEIPTEVKPANGYATVRPKTDAKAVTYIALDGVYPFPSDLLADKRLFVLPSQGLAAGRYRFVAVGSLNDEHVTVEFAVVVGDGPKPPPPPDPVNPPPIAGDGLKVIIVFEKKEQMKLTPGQLNAMHGIEMYDYMKSKNGQWYVADKDNTGTGLMKEWSDALKRPRKTLPWIIVSNGKTGFEGELPKTTEDILTLIKKYGGE